MTSVNFSSNFDKEEFETLIKDEKDDESEQKSETSHDSARVAIDAPVVVITTGILSSWFCAKWSETGSTWAKTQCFVIRKKTQTTLIICCRRSFRSRLHRFIVVRSQEKKNYELTFAISWYPKRFRILFVSSLYRDWIDDQETQPIRSDTQWRFNCFLYPWSIFW